MVGAFGAVKNFGFGVGVSQKFKGALRGWSGGHWGGAKTVGPHAPCKRRFPVPQFKP